MNNQKKIELQRLMWMANVQAFYPDKMTAELQTGYQRWQEHRRTFQRLYVEQQPETKEIVVDKLETLHPGILFTFHFGPYRLLPRLLVAAGYRLTLLVSATVLEREQESYRLMLSRMGLSPEHFECLDAGDPLVLRKLLHAVAMDRIVLVFLDANESSVKMQEKERAGRLRVPFGGSYFYWRSNLLKLAHRYDLPVQALHLKPDGAGTTQSWQLAEPRVILNSGSKTPEALLEALTSLQQTFQEMIDLDWTAWENWALIHHYLKADSKNTRGLTRQGGWMLPFSFTDKAYLFDLFNKRFYEIIANKEKFN